MLAHEYPFCISTCKGEHLFIGKVVIDDHIRLLNALLPLQRKEADITRSRSDQIDLSGLSILLRFKHKTSIINQTGPSCKKDSPENTLSHQAVATSFSLRPKLSSHVRARKLKFAATTGLAYFYVPLCPG